MDIITAMLSDIQATIMNIVLCSAAAFLGYKKILTHSNKEDLDAAKAKAEKDIIEMLYSRLADFDKINNKLMTELETLRREYIQTRHHNEEMIKEIQHLKKFISLNFAPTFDSTKF